MNAALYLIPPLAVTVFLLIRANMLDRQRQVYFFKPLSTLLVIAMALLSLLEPEQNLTYLVGAGVGLVLSLGGDVALMFRGNRAFVIGLLLFLLAHVAYALTFSLLSRFSAWDALTAAILLALALGFYRLIRPGLGSLRFPVIAYMAVISLMVNRAAATLFSPAFSSAQALMVTLGAVLFYASDMILAANRFWKPWPYHHLSLALYYGGQMLIALAASYFGQR